MFTQIILSEILYKFLIESRPKKTNNFEKNWTINRAEIIHASNNFV